MIGSPLHNTLYILPCACYFSFAYRPPSIYPSLPISTFSSIDYHILASHRGKGSLENFGIYISLTMSQIIAVHKWVILPQNVPSVRVTLIFVTVCSLFIILLLREICSPVHLPTIFRRKQWRLPPGPSGYPLIGTLLEFRHARRSTPALIQYVQIRSLTPRLSLRPANVNVFSSPPSPHLAK